MDKTGWLKKQLDQVEQEVSEWPKWKFDVENHKKGSQTRVPNTTRNEKQKKDKLDK